MKFQKPKGTMDILPQEAEKWQFVENKAREIFKLYHFGELRTPIFENFEVIVRSIMPADYYIFVDLTVSVIFFWYNKCRTFLGRWPNPLHFYSLWRHLINV